MLSRHLRTHLVVAPSTSVGKSIFSTGLVRASLALGERVGYLKPVGTGSGDGDDELHLNKFAKGVKTACLYHFDEPVSPHLAVERSAREGEREGKGNLRVPTDREFVSAVGGYVRGFEQETKGNRSSLYIESAGGVHSPTLNGTSQLDAFRPLLPPTLLIASHQLGGISTTISAYESLSLRGYEVDQVLCFRESYYANHEYFTKWFGKRGIRVGVVEEPPKQDPERDKDEQNLESYYKGIERESELGKVVEDLQRIHVKRIEELETASKRTLDKVWWPFVQHGLVKSEKEVMVIDSAYQDTFSVFTSNSNDTNDNQSTSTPSDDEASSSSSESAAVSPVLPPPPTPTPTSQQPPPPSSSDDNSTPTSTTSPSRSSSSNSNSSSLLLSQVFDGSASWWTQCLGHSHPELVLAASHSMGRFGHVMFPSATNLPALQLAEKLLESVGKGWADRVFFSDNGSTGMEVGLKMALRSFTEREGKGKGASSLGVLGLKGSYHGDTIGAMDACEGGVYSERVEWYQGRGYWLEAPEMRIEEGKVVVRGRGGKELKRYDHLNEVYETDRRRRGAVAVHCEKHVWI